MTDAKTTSGKMVKSDGDWRRELTPMQYAVLREKATERPFSGEYEHEHRAGRRNDSRRHFHLLTLKLMLHWTDKSTLCPPIWTVKST